MHAYTYILHTYTQIKLVERPVSCTLLTCIYTYIHTYIKHSYQQQENKQTKHASGGTYRDPHIYTHTYTYTYIQIMLVERPASKTSLTVVRGRFGTTALAHPKDSLVTILVVIDQVYMCVCPRVCMYV
jgi:hypothetical protein